MSVTKFPRLLIGSVAADGALTVSGTTGSLTAGQIGFATLNGVLTNAAGTVDSNGNAKDLIVAQGTGAVDGSIKSYPMLAKKVKKVWSKTYTATTAQVSYAGYDGADATKTLGFKCDTNYSLGIQLYSSLIEKYYGDAGLKRYITITTPCCDNCDTGCDSEDCVTQSLAITKLFNEDISIKTFVSAVVVNNGTFSASSGGALTVAVDGVTVTIVESAGAAADAGKYNSDASTFVAGDLIRIGGTGNTVAVYKIASITGAGTALATVILTAPYQGATGSVSAANAGHIATDGTACGIKITGKFIDRNSGCSCEPVYPYDVDGVEFTIFPNDGAAGLATSGWDCLTPDQFATYTTAVAFGNGSGLELVYLENEIEGYTVNREFWYDPRFQENHVNYASVAVNYDIYYIAFDNAYDSTTIQGEYSDHHITIIAVPTGSTVGTNIKTLLNTWVIAEPISITPIP